MALTSLTGLSLFVQKFFKKTLSLRSQELLLNKEAG